MKVIYMNYLLLILDLVQLLILGMKFAKLNKIGKWYEINDTRGYEIKKLSNFYCLYGLFNKIRKNKTDNINNEMN